MQNYKIKAFSQHMGVPLDTIKHYQHSGILKPIIDPENSYRYYNMTHGERLIVSKKFRNLGFSVEETSQLISSKDGPEIMDMLSIRRQQIEEELRILQSQHDIIQYQYELCETFNKQEGTYKVCNRPAFYYYRHTKNTSFIPSTKDDPMIKSLMENLPYTIKLLIRSINPEEPDYHYCIGLKEDYLSYVHNLDLTDMKYAPSVPAILYIYSKPHSMVKRPNIYKIADIIRADGYELADEPIYIENAIDFYRDGVRYENYLIYYALKK